MQHPRALLLWDLMWVSLMVSELVGFYREIPGRKPNHQRKGQSIMATTYGKTQTKTRPIAAIATAAAIAAIVTGCNSGNSAGQDYSPGYNSDYGSYQNAYNQAQDEQYGANGAQGPGVTTNDDEDAGTGGDYDGSGT
jgi:hypothetical protein